MRIVPILLVLMQVATPFLFVRSISATAASDDAYLGCFKDEKDRDLPHKAYESNKNNTPDLCIETCAEADYKYAGLVYGHKCGNSYGRYGSRDETECAMKCPGDRTLMCGDYLRLSVYKTPLAPPENACGFRMGSDISIPNPRYTRLFTRVKMEVLYINTQDVPEYEAFLECCPDGPISVVADVSSYECKTYLDTGSPDLKIAHGTPSKSATLCVTPEVRSSGPIWNVVVVSPRNESVPATPWSVQFSCAAK